LDRIFKSHAFRTVVLEPTCGCPDVSEDFSNDPLGDKDRHRSRGTQTVAFCRLNYSITAPTLRLSAFASSIAAKIMNGK
jgi:hypothetical protein